MHFLSKKLSIPISMASSNSRSCFISLAGGLVVVATAALFISCGGSSSGSNSGSTTTPTPGPSILNVNNATDPSSPVSRPIQINGSSFQGAPGSVVFTQASSGITATVTPNAAGWTDSAIAVTVPTGNGTNLFTVPGSVTVAVKTSEGTSNSKDLTLAQTLKYSANSLNWTTATATPLPVISGLAGLRAVAVSSSSTSAYVVVTGGYNGTANTQNVYVGPLDPTGLISVWTPSANILPESTAFHAMVEADSTNSLVPTGSNFIYVIGGQVNAGSTPGGTANVYMAPVNSSNGAVGTWTQLSSSLPEPLVGPAATLFNGYVYVIGGLHPDSTPSADVFSAPVKSDGTLGSWTQSANPYPTAVSFATAFGFGGKLYVLGGDSSPSVSPNAQGTATGVTNVNFASVQNGVVGTWTPTSPTLYKRKKQVTWTASGQVIDAEGVYDATPGTQELELSQINSDGTLTPWTGISIANAPNANVYNAAAIVSPLQSYAATPRFILIGGEDFGTFSQIQLSNQVYYNNAP